MNFAAKFFIKIILLVSFIFFQFVFYIYQVSAAGINANIRVGIVASEDFETELARWREYFSACSAASGGRFKFYIAPGTYGDILYWMNEELIDLAVATSAVFAENRRYDGLKSGIKDNDGFDYLATLDMRPASGPWAEEFRKKNGHHFTYRAICVVPAESPFKTFNDLITAYNKNCNDIRFIFADPLSVSGRIIPEFALRKSGIIPDRKSIRYAFSHTGVLRLLAASKPELKSVGFVWDDAISSAPELAKKLKKLPFKELESIELPHDVIAVRRRLADKELLSKVLLEYKDPENRIFMEKLDTKTAPYEKILEWSHNIGISFNESGFQTVSLDEIGQILQHYAKSQPLPPRLALVLSGGGAKCSYQAGAISAIEEKLERTKKTFKNINFDIDMVVGTSGGAVNALPVALGITQTQKGREELKKVWTRLDQRMILQPPILVRVISGLWLAMLEAGTLLIIVRRFSSSSEKHASLYFIILMFTALLEIVFTALPFTPWKFLGNNHIIHHIWLFFDIAMRASAFPLLLFSLAGYALQRIIRRRGRSLHFKSIPLVLLSIALLIFLPVLLITAAFFFSETLSGGEGLENILAESFLPLIELSLKENNLAPLKLSTEQIQNTDNKTEINSKQDNNTNLNTARYNNCINSDKFKIMSRRIFNDKLLKRDLIVTANALEQSRSLLPNDLYFYSWRNNKTNIFGTRGININEHPEMLIDIIMGSSSIFPIFPPRRLYNFPESNEWIDLIDGGFAHNSPIEAAVLRGATHIILIESTPEERGERKTLAANIAAAFEHLHKQTQLIDLRSKKHVVIFTLVPKPPHICMLDFTDTLIEESIKSGYLDARGESNHNAGTEYINTVTPFFKKELGEPVFNIIN